MTNGETYSNDYFTFYGCTDNNEFQNTVYECEAKEEQETVNLEKEILDLYFKKGSLKPRHRQLSHIKNELVNFDFKAVTKTLHNLESKGIIQFNGDLSHITKQGISYYHNHHQEQ